MANPTKQEVKEWVRLFVSQQGNQTGLDGLDDILDVIIDVAWSGTPGPPPELDYCLQVDRAQSFTDEQKQQGRDNLGIEDVDTSKCLRVDLIQSFTNAEKALGVQNLGPQQILDAIKELAGTLKNKTIDADDNIIKDITGKEVKDGFLVGDIPNDRFFYGWEHTTMPDVFTKSTADAASIDIYGIQDGKMVVVDTGRISAGTLVRDTVAYARKDSVDGYYVNDSDIKFAGLDLALKILALVKSLKATFQKVSTFTGVTGDTAILYYLDTKYGTYETGFYVFNGTAFVNVDQKCIQYVSTFTGVDGDPDVLYYLDTAYDTYKAGFYRFVPAAGTTPAKFVPLSDSEVFTDVDELPDTDISKETIYRIPYTYYEYQGQKVEKEDAVWYGPGAQCLNMACDNTNGLSLETASQSYQYPLADITDALVQQLITDQLIQVKSTETDAPMFKVAPNSYCPTEDVTEVDGGYKLYHNPTETDGEYIEIGGEAEESPFIAGTGLNSAVLKGGNNAAGGSNSVAEGRGTKTGNEGEHAEGKFNYSYKANAGEEDFATRHSVGIGTSDVDRKNAVEILADGEMFLKGAGGYDGTNMRQGTGADMKVDPSVKSVQKLLSYIPTKEQRLTISTTGSGTLSVSKTGNAPATKMQYSLDGEEWTEATIPFQVPFTDAIYLRGENKEYASSTSDYTTIEVQGKEFSVSGNIMSLIYGANVHDRRDLPSAMTFALLFSGTMVSDASGLILPSEALTPSCYNRMFQNCTSLVAAPELPATSLAQSCYNRMFQGCTSLATAPALPSGMTAPYCYYSMFQGCTSLAAAPALPANVMAPYCYASMFADCTSLTAAPALAATALAVNCYNRMFMGCTSLTAEPELPATTLVQSCYLEMFRGCTSITTATLSATSLAPYCCYQMFYGCTGLTSATLNAVSVAPYCYYAMFRGCTSLTTAPELPARSLEQQCYQQMFYGCTSLVAAPALRATSLAPSCYSAMFRGCTSLATAPELPAMSLEQRCYQQMFYGCTSLTAAPALPAPELAMSCYADMFNGCSGLNAVTCLAEDLAGVNVLTSWLASVSATGTFTKKAGVTWPTGASGIPTGWTVVEVGGDVGTVFTDVATLPTTDIDSDTIYRTRDVSYEYEGVQFPKSELVWYGPGPDCTSMDADDIGVNIRAASGNRSYPWGSVNAALIQELRDLNLVAVGVGEADAVFFSHFATYGPKSGLTEIYGDYHLYHNPSQTAGGYIEIGGDAVQYVSTFAGVTGDTSALYYLDTAYGDYKVGFYRFNGTFQFIGTDVILTVETLPTTGISDSVFYRLVEYHKYDNGWEIPVANTFMSNSPRMVISPSGIEYTDPQSQIHPYFWSEVTDSLVEGWMTGGELVNVPLSDRNLEGKFYKKQDGTYDAMNGGTVYVYVRNEYKLYHNPTKSLSGYIEVGGGSNIVLDEVTTETVDGKVQANAIIDVTTLPTTAIKAKTIYRMPVDKYYEDGAVLPATPTGYVSIRPAIVIIDENGITDNGTFYAWADITDAQMDFWVIRRQISEVYAADLMTNSTCFKTAANHYVYKDHVTKGQVYELYHNPTATANAFIKIGGEEGGSVEVDEVTTEEVNGKVQANAVIVVNDLPTTGIKTKSIYRRMTQVYRHDGVEVNSVSPYKVRPNDTLDATPDGLWYKPSGPTVAWTDSNIAQVVSDGIVGGYIEATTWENADFFGYGDDPTSGNFDYKNHFSRLLPGSLWQNPTGTEAGWEEVGKDPVIDEVTIVEENSILQAVAVIDVTTLPFAGMKVNSLYRKVETVMVPGLHIYTTYYHGGADPVPEPVECYKPARAGVEFRTNEIYIDSVQHSYEELKVYKADWVAAGYIVACDFLDIDTTTNDGAVGYPNEGSYQFLNRYRYTYNTDPVPVVMNKIFQRTPGGEWESISTVQISNAAYNELDYDQKMDGTTYIVEG